MSIEKKHLEQDSLNPIQVEDYLHLHPDFFHDHLALLEQMSIPHPSGNAVSLISKQLELFRHKHHELEKQLNSLIDIARENDTSFNRMHELTLALIEAKTLKQIMLNLDEVFSNSFLTDFSSIRIISDRVDSELEKVFINRDYEQLSHFENELNNNQPFCGKPTLAQAKFLFADDALEVKSCVIIPMLFTRLEGIIAIGSRDKDRFHYSMGKIFLSQMSEIIGTRIISLMD